MAETAFYEFGPFRVDLARRLLFKDGGRVPLAAKPFEILVLLVEHRERALSREELARRIWPGLSVTDNNFNVTLRTVRRALGESARSHQYILTTPEGYRFIAPVTEQFTEISEPEADGLASPAGDRPEQTPPAYPPDRHTPSPSQPLIEDQKYKTVRTGRLIAAALGVVLLLGAALLLAQIQRRRKATTASENPPAQEVAPRNPSSDAANLSPLEGEVIRLTDHPARDGCPSWSPDGKLVAFISNREKTTYWGDIWAVNVDGSNLRRLTAVPDSPHGLAQRPVWIGTTGDLAILETVNYHEILRFHLSANPKLPVIRTVEDFDSPFFTRLLVVPGRRGAGSFTLTRDGTRAAWVVLPKPWYSCPTTGAVRTSLVSSLNGGNVLETGTQVVSNWFDCEIQPGKSPMEGISFSPDGAQIVVAKNPDPKVYGFDLEIYNLDGKLVRRLTDDGGGASPVTNWNPDWSSDNRIAFASNRSGRFEVYTISPDGSDLRQITSKGGDFPCWSPDGRRIVFQSERDGNPDIYVITLK